MASSLENVSSDWVAVELSAVAVVLPESACGREIAAYYRSAVSSFGEHGCVAWTYHAEGGGRGDHHAVATRVEAGAIMARWPQASPWQRGRRTGRGLQAAGAWLAFVQ